MKRFELLDYGRFLAAIFVMLFHYTYNGIANGKINSISFIPSVIQFTKYGYLGVEFFFMISGFVIFFSAKNRSATEFAVNRATRLYPAYWFAVLFTSFFALKWGGKSMSVYPSQIIINFSMLQNFFEIPDVDGVYWTLVYEITFYFAVFLILLFGFQKHLNFIFLCWPILFCVALTLDKQSLPCLGKFYYFFSAGTLFAILKEKCDWRAISSLLVSYFFCITYSIERSLRSDAINKINYSPEVIGFIVTGFFVIFVFQNTKMAQSLKLPLSRLFGALTYPLYLVHAHFGYMFISRFATEENRIYIYTLTIFIVLSVAFIINNFIEVRLAAFWKAFFKATLIYPINFIKKILSRVHLKYRIQIKYKS